MASLSSNIFQKKYGKNYHLIINYLSEYDIISVNKQYSDGKSRKYKFVNNFLINDVVDIEINLDSSFGKYVKKRHNEESKLAKGKPLYIRNLRKHFYDLKYDSQKAIEELNLYKNKLNNEQYLAIHNDILCFNFSNLKYFKRNKTNSRIDTNLTSLKSYFKKFIISDVPLFQLDLKNSQPVLFNIFLNKIEELIYNNNLNTKDYNSTLYYKNNYIKSFTSLIYKEIQKDSKWGENLKKDIPIYRKYTSEGKWYEHLSDVYNEHYSTDIFNRNLTKSLWMALAYSTNYSKKYNECKKAFENKFKGIAKLFRKMKQKEYNQLAIYLQQIEAEIFIDNIAKKLTENQIMPLTIHDCIIIKETEVEMTKNIMNEILNEHLGFTHIIDVEALNELEFMDKYNAEDVAKFIADLK